MNIELIQSPNPGTISKQGSKYFFWLQGLLWTNSTKSSPLCMFCHSTIIFQWGYFVKFGLPPPCIWSPERLQAASFAQLRGSVKCRWVDDGSVRPKDTVTFCFLNLTFVLLHLFVVSTLTNISNAKGCICFIMKRQHMPL